MGHRSLSTPIIGDGVVYCASDDGRLFALDGATIAPVAAATTARRVVYWEGKKSAQAFNWFANGVDVTVRNYFKSAGYEQMNAGQLTQFMSRETAGHARSVVVFADNKIPAALARDPVGHPLIRSYLDAGGKVVVFGSNPLAYRADPKTGVVESVDFEIPRRVFGINFPEPARGNGYYVAHVTAAGQRWGLRDTSIGANPIEAEDATTVLAEDEFGMASSWLKSYGGREGTGLLQLTIPRSTPTDLAPYLAPWSTDCNGRGTTDSSRCPPDPLIRS